MNIPSRVVRIRVWLQAARPLAQANIALPLLVGQALAFATCGRFSGGRCALILLFGVLDQLFIVFANDAADWRADLENRTFNIYSGGSRVIPEGKLGPKDLAHAALYMVLAMAALCFYLTMGMRLMWMLLLCAACVFVLWAYSFPPFKLSYRGNGEILQGIGLGLLLPAIGFYVQCADLSEFPMTAFLPMFLLGYAGNITTALPDAPADRAVGKRSYPVRRGEFRARRDSLIVIALALALAPWSFGQHVSWPWAVSSGAALACLLVNLRGITHADADRARACLRFVTLSGAAIAIAELAFISALVTSRTGAG